MPSPHRIRHFAVQAVSGLSSLLPVETGRRTERWFRGYDEVKRLTDADAVIVSPGKSGRTWMRVMISRYFAHKFGIAEGSLMDYDEFHRENPAVPVLFFTHDNYLKDYLGHADKLKTYGAKRVVLLVRDPRDTSVSSYFQWKHRMKFRKKIINGFPDQDVSILDFVTGSPWSARQIVDYLNLWAKDLPQFKSLLLVRYEDLRRDPAQELRRILEFIGQQPAEAEVADAVTYASLENMRERERGAATSGKVSGRLRPGDASDPSTFKARRGKVGGWRDYFTPEQQAGLDQLVERDLSPVYGYGPAAEGVLVSRG